MEYQKESEEEPLGDNDSFVEDEEPPIDISNPTELRKCV